MNTADLREKAILMLEEAKMIDDEKCLVDETRVRIADKDMLLNQLKNNEPYLSVPMALFFSSPFWRRLKAKSNEMMEILAQNEKQS